MVLLYKYLLSLCSVICFVRRVKIFKYSCSYPTSLKIMSANCSSLYVNSQCSKSFMKSFKLKNNFWVESYKSTITREWIIRLSCGRSLILRRIFLLWYHWLKNTHKKQKWRCLTLHRFAFACLKFGTMFVQATVSPMASVIFLKVSF